MRIIGETLLNAYEGKIINIHPALLPAFPGRDGIGDALNYGVKVMGVTVHYVDAGIDTGNIIDQACFKRTGNETREEVETRIHALEHEVVSASYYATFTSLGGVREMKRALVSVSDKTNLVSFVQNLVELGYEIISTGGTKKTLEEAGMNVIAIDEVTGFPEILEGRVKTLHPMVHGGLLAKRDDAHHQEQVTQNNIEYIDLVCVNLYPFAKTIQNPEATHEDKIENIDIGGPSMLRSAAKNFNDVTVVVDANDYDLIISEIREQGNTTLKTRQMLAGKVFNHTAAYDAMIANYFNEINEVEVPEKLTVTYDLKQTLRYGENPHQKAAFYQTLQQPSYSVVSSEQLHGKELSYNNIQMQTQL